jgi:hypothetical protein
VLEESQLAAASKHAPQLGERAGDVGHAAQGE